MKKLFFLSTRYRALISEILPVFLLIPAIAYNNRVNTVMRLYPLIFALSALIIFMFIYFFRGILLSADEIRCVGLFSSKDKAMIKKDRVLVVSIMKKHRVSLEIFGTNDDTTETYAWLKKEEPTMINLYRARANGSASVAKRIMKYFDVEEADIAAALSNESFSAEYDKISLNSSVSEESRRIAITFKETI